MPQSRAKTENSGVAIIILAILVFSKILLSPLGGLDELWNYDLCRGVAMGYIPYRDFSMVMMPLFTILFSLPLMIVRKLIVYRLSTAAFLLVVTLLVYKTTAEVTDRSWGLILSCLWVAFMDIATYNTLVFLLIVIIYRLFCRELNGKRAFVTGVLCALGILSRQTSGVFLTVAVIVMMFVCKEFRKRLPALMAGGTSIMLLFLVYLIATDSWKQFWDCCLFALLVSGETNTAFYANSILALLISLAGIVFDVMLWKKNRDRKDIFHLIFGLLIITIGIPVIDMMHLCYGAVWFTMPLLKSLCASKFRTEIKPSVLRLTTGLIVVTVMLLTGYWVLGASLDGTYEEFALIPSSDGLMDSYGEIAGINADYRAQGKRVVVYSSSACIISIIEGAFNPPYDLFLNGNLGTREPVSFVEADVLDDNSIILIPNDYDTENWENPDGVYEYITSHCEPIDSYGRFVWYRPVSPVTSQDV